MPSEDMMKQLDDELEAAIAAKKAQAIIATLTKIRNDEYASVRRAAEEALNSLHGTHGDTTT